jgi:hypothetical protein
VGWRPIKFAAKSCKSSPSSTRQTPSVMGNSIPRRRERSRRTGAVVRPSTVPIRSAASSGERASRDQLAGRGRLRVVAEPRPSTPLCSFFLKLPISDVSDSARRLRRLRRQQWT